MKKFIVLTILGFQVFGETYSLDNFLNNQKENELIKISEKKLDVVDAELKKKNYNEIKFLLNTEKRKGTDEGERINFNMTYGDFYYNIGKKINEEEIAVQSVGFSKNINGIFYGEEIYKQNSYKLEKQIISINNEKIKNEVSLNIVKAYGNLVKIQEKIKLQNNYKTNMALEKINMKKRYENGDLSNIDYEAFNLEEKSINIELDNLKKEHDLAKTELFSLSGFYFTDRDSLESLSSDGNINLENIGKKELEKLSLEKAKEEESSKFSFLQDRLQFDLKGEYTLKEDNYVVSLSISDRFKLENFQGKKEKLDTEEIDFKIRDQKIKTHELKEKYILDYEKQLSTISLDKEKLELDRKNLSIKEKKYRIGDMSYIDYIKELEKFKEKEKTLLEKEIDLAVFLKSLAYF